MDFDSVIELSRNAHLNWSHTSFAGTNYMNTSISQTIPQTELFDDVVNSHLWSPVMIVSQISSPTPRTTTNGKAPSPGPTETWDSEFNTRQRIQDLKAIPNFKCARCPRSTLDRRHSASMLVHTPPNAHFRVVSAKRTLYG